MEKKNILIGPSTFGQADSAPLERLSASGYGVIANPFKRKLTGTELRSLLRGNVVALIAGLETIDRGMMEGSRLKVISRCGAGMSNVDLKSAGELGIKVYSTPDAPTTAVAELTVCAVLSLLRAVPLMNDAMHERRWDKRIGLQLEGKSVAIIGFGRIGQRVSEILNAFNAVVTAVDRMLSGTVKGVRIIGLDEALKKADIIILHASGDKQILGKREFGLIKKGAYLLNAARGGLIDEAELLKAVDSGRLTGAWIDVFEDEPYSGPLCLRQQVILTPHAGSYTLECRRRMELEAADNVIRGLDDAE